MQSDELEMLYEWYWASEVAGASAFKPKNKARNWIARQERYVISELRGRSSFGFCVVKCLSVSETGCVFNEKFDEIGSRGSRGAR